MTAPHTKRTTPSTMPLLHSRILVHRILVHRVEAILRKGDVLTVLEAE